MKVTDYIVDFLINKNVTDVFGYPGGAICHFIDSLAKREEIEAHLLYHEQAAAFAACGYAQESGKLGVAYSTSGPGATNLVSGVANAYFDSIPTLFICGQTDTYSLKGKIPVRQRGFQEVDIVSMTSTISKHSIRIMNPNEVPCELERAYCIATEGNPGPVVIDLPADVQRAEIEIVSCNHFEKLETHIDITEEINRIVSELTKASRPCLLVGNGVKQSGCIDEINALIEKLKIPTVFSMPAYDILSFDSIYNLGFIGANGHRYANFILGKSNLIITIGTRLDLKQVGNKRENFAKQAKIIRIDVDEGNFGLPIRDDDINICADMRYVVPELLRKTKVVECDSEWLEKCRYLKERLYGVDDLPYTQQIRELLATFPENSTIIADVGQSEVWIPQIHKVKKGQSVHMSAGHGTMGYSLPAAIGAYYANHRRVISINGDGGIQMNIQELQFLARERIPICVLIINNHALGMIRGFQEANFEKRYVHTIEDNGYLPPVFKDIAVGYHLEYYNVSNETGLSEMLWESNNPFVLELEIREDTYLLPNFGQNGLIQDQRPYLDRKIYEELMMI